MTEELSGLVTADTKATPVLLTAVRVEGNIAGRGARVKIIQSFKNGEDKDNPYSIQIVGKESKYMDYIHEEKLSPPKLDEFIELLGKIRKNQD